MRELGRRAASLNKVDDIIAADLRELLSNRPKMMKNREADTQKQAEGDSARGRFDCFR